MSTEADHRMQDDKAGATEMWMIGLQALFALCLVSGLLILNRTFLSAVVFGPPVQVQSMSAMFSPHGKQILTFRDDKHTADIWDASTGRHLLNLAGHTDYLYDVRYSPDRKQIVSTSHDGTARIWDAPTGKELLLVRPPGEIREDIEWSPDGKRILLTSLDGQTMSLWDATSGRELLQFKPPTPDRICFPRFSPDGQRLITTDCGRVIDVWDTSNGTLLAQLVGHAEEIRGAVFSPHGGKIATAGADKTGRIWDASTGKETGVLRGHADWVNSIAFSPDSRQVATASDDGTVRIWDAETGNLMFAPGGDYHEKHSVTYSFDGKQILSWGYFHEEAQLWDAGTGREMAVLKVPKYRVNGWEVLTAMRDAEYSADGKRVVTAHMDGTARVWDAATGRELLVIRTR